MLCDGETGESNHDRDRDHELAAGFLFADAAAVASTNAAGKEQRTRSSGRQHEAESGPAALSQRFFVFARQQQ